jgi:uncharacterized protein (TIGR02466 family)
MNLPNELTQLMCFSSPIYTEHKPEWINYLNNICDKYIKKSKQFNEKVILEIENKLNKKIGDFGMSHHSESLIQDSDFKEFQKYVGERSLYILDHMGYDLKNYDLYFNELWVQEFSKLGGGHHEGHVHSNNHISGFYFLKCSDKTSYPVFHDPRTSKSIIQLPLKNESEMNVASEKIYITPSPGVMVYFPAYLTHQFVLDNGIEPFRFIHFNLQAIKKMGKI